MPRPLSEDLRFRALRLLAQNPEMSQRALAAELGIALGSVNYLLAALVEKGHIKARNFRNSQNKLGYAYVLTPKGVAEKAALATGFLRRKMAEYEALRAELEALMAESRGLPPVPNALPPEPRPATPSGAAHGR